MPNQFIVIDSVTPILILNLNRIFINVSLTVYAHVVTVRRARAEPDGTRSETTFRLSPKRTSPFKSAGESVQSTAGSRGVRIGVSNAG